MIACYDPMCAICNQNNRNECLKCSTNNPSIILDPKTKTCVCAEGSYLRDSKCISCHPLCKACNGPSNSECISCATSAFPMQKSPKTCLWMCKSDSEQLFIDISDNYCKSKL